MSHFQVSQDFDEVWKEEEPEAVRRTGGASRRRAWCNIFPLCLMLLEVSDQLQVGLRSNPVVVACMAIRPARGLI